MINKDYILRLAERLGRELAIILRLRRRDLHEEVLIAIDDLLFNNTGLTSSFINSLPEETLLKALSPLGTAQFDHSRWLTVAAWLKAEGEVYEDMQRPEESFYRYSRSLFLYLETLKHDHIDDYPQFAQDIRELLQVLAEYELSTSLTERIFWYYEYKGQYAKAEDVLFELLESSNEKNIRKLGEAFYLRLQHKHDADLLAGDFSREEIQEGLNHIQHLKN